jgi:NADH:ubiquinone reductase (H+-translocating)
MAYRIIILGGGFAGLTAARRLERLLPPAAARVTLINDVNFMLYTPLLPGAAGGTLEPRHVVVPLREELDATDLRIGTVTGADPATRRVFMRTADGRDEEHVYDQLIVALGSTSRTLPIPGLREHALGFKTIAEAIALRNQVLQTLEQAESAPSDEERHALLTYVMVGGGYAGLEGIAELQDFAADVIDKYPRCRLHGVRCILVEAKDRVMQEVAPDLSAFAQDELRRRGMEFRLNTTVERVSADSIELSTGEVVPTRTVVWTTGVKPHPVVAELGLPLTEGGRIEADRYCQVAGHPNVWAIGDAAAVPDPAHPERPSPPTAQHSVRQAKVVAHNVANAMGRGHKRPFRYRTLGVFVDMGRHQAVADTFGIKWRGFPAWFLARTYHLAQMPGNRRRARLMADWTIGLMFGRDSAELGQLGHPPGLDTAENSEATARSAADAERAASPSAGS